MMYAVYHNDWLACRTPERAGAIRLVAQLRVLHPGELFYFRHDDTYVTPPEVIDYIEAHAAIDPVCGAGGFIAQCAIPTATAAPDPLQRAWEP